MPEPNRPAWRIADGLGTRPFEALAADRVTVRLECEACHHRADWSPAAIGRMSQRFPTQTLERIGRRLRCGRCGSNWVRIYRAG